MTQPKTASKHTPGPLIQWEKENSKGTLISICHHVGPLESSDHACVAKVQGKTPEEAEANVRLFVKAPEMYELLGQINGARDNILSIERAEGKVSMTSLSPSPTILDWSDIVDEARRIKAAIDGEG